ncbi:unnamed protein product [Microthlaspi erraticum]|uniref:Uncharacterized protein n=1 Tax=Microthlaspi erraticum TaxID=1685480 RepID=A0A6D2HBW6_9BRAS|nr:unnamed protein product [Microthlaspi erraticum]
MFFGQTHLSLCLPVMSLSSDVVKSVRVVRDWLRDSQRSISITRSIEDDDGDGDWLDVSSEWKIASVVFGKDDVVHGGGIDLSWVGGERDLSRVRNAILRKLSSIIR